MSLSDADSELKLFCEKNPSEIDHDVLNECFSYVVKKASNMFDLETAVQYMYLVRMYQKLLPESERQTRRVESVKQRLIQNVDVRVKSLKHQLSQRQNSGSESLIKVYQMSTLVTLFKKFLSNQSPSLAA